MSNFDSTGNAIISSTDKNPKTLSITRTDTNSQTAGITTFAEIQMSISGVNNDLGVLSFLTNNGVSNYERMRIDPNGNIGVGTNIPNHKLEVAKDISSTDDDAQIVASGLTNTNKGLALGFDTSNDIGFIYAREKGFGAKNLVLGYPGGNVGIGTTSPSSKLHISADTDAQQTISSYFSAANRFSYLFLDKGRGTAAAPSSVLNGDEIFRIYGRAYNAGAMRNTTRISSIVDGAPGAASVPGALVFYTSTNSSFDNEAMRITSGGKVGIGVNPDAKLDLSFDSPSASNKAVEFEYTGAGASDFDILRNSIQNAQTARRFRIRGGNDFDTFTSFSLGMVSYHPLRFMTNDTERIRITADGKVGIGTTNPQVKLSIGGSGANIYATDAWIENNMHIQGNETLAQGGRGRLRAGTAWGYMGLYADGSSTGAANDLVLGATSGKVRIGPDYGGQNLYVNGDVAILGKHAFRGNDSYLRINQDNAFTSGTHFSYRANFYRGITTGSWWDVEPGVGNLLVQGSVGIGTSSPLSDTGLDVRSGYGRIVGNGLFFYGSGNATDNLPYARLIESWGMRFNAPDDRWVLSSWPSILIGYQPDGRYWGYGNLFVSGNVGIGRTDPEVKVHVLGNRIRLQSEDWQRFVDLRADGDALDLESNVDLYINNNGNTVWIRKYRVPSSRELKEHITKFSIKDAFEALESLNPIKFKYKGDKSGELHLGFIAEDVSSHAATPDGKGISPMAMIAILAKVVKEQQKAILALQKAIAEQ